MVPGSKGGGNTSAPTAGTLVRDGARQYIAALYGQ